MNGLPVALGGFGGSVSGSSFAEAVLLGELELETEELALDELGALAPDLEPAHAASARAEHETNTTERT
jgi:hypothetical protein